MSDLIELVVLEVRVGIYLGVYDDGGEREGGEDEGGDVHAGSAEKDEEGIAVGETAHFYGVLEESVKERRKKGK